jgi:hypothetical protein
MNALNLFKNILMPHLWLTNNVIGLGAATLGSAAIGAASSLFGGGGDDSSDTISGFAALPKFLKSEFRNTSIPRIEDLFNQGPQSFFPDQTFANLTPDQQAGLQSQLNFSQNQLPQQLGDVNQSFGNALNAGSIFGDPSVQAGLGTIENRANRNFSENVLPQLRQQATGTGNQFSSKAEQSERLAGRDLQQAISDSQGSFLANQLGSARGLQGSAIGNAPNITQLGLQPGSNQFNVGSVFQGQNQAGINDQVNAFNFNQQAPSNQLNQYLAQLQGVAGSGGGAGSSSTQSAGNSTNPFAGALGGAAIGSSLFNQFGGGGGLAPNFTNPSPMGQNVGNNVFQNPSSGFLTQL